MTVSQAGSVAAEILVGLAAGEPEIRIEQLFAGYGRTEVLHGVELRLGHGQSICLIGPNGAGKSTVLKAMYGLADIRAGRIVVQGRDVTHMQSHDRLRHASMAYVLQESSIFPDMSVEQNLRLGGYIFSSAGQVAGAVAELFDRYPQLRDRRRLPARALSGGERRLLEVTRALMTEPRVLLVDEPSVSLDPRGMEAVFGLLHDAQHVHGMAVIVVEQNARKGLQFADLGYLLVGGRVVRAGRASDLLADPDLGRRFLPF